MPAVEDIAKVAYPVMRRWLRENRATRTTITYGELSARLPPPFTGLDPHTAFSGPLGYICERCRAAGLPALSAMVVGADTRYPGPGYFPAAHGRKFSDPQALIEWANELALVWSARFPNALP